MNTEEITIRVDAETATAYRAADEQLKSIVALRISLALSSADPAQPSALERWDALVSSIDERLTPGEKEEIMREVESLS